MLLSWNQNLNKWFILRYLRDIKFQGANIAFKYKEINPFWSVSVPSIRIKKITNKKIWRIRDGGEREGVGERN